MIFITNLSTFLHYYPQNKTIESIKGEKIYIFNQKTRSIWFFLSFCSEYTWKKISKSKEIRYNFQKSLRIQEKRKKNYTKITVKGCRDEINVTISNEEKKEFE